jgi:hypothetical protein
MFTHILTLEVRDVQLARVDEYRTEHLCRQYPLRGPTPETWVLTNHQRPDATTIQQSIVSFQSKTRIRVIHPLFVPCVSRAGITQASVMWNSTLCCSFRQFFVSSYACFSRSTILTFVSDIFYLRFPRESLTRSVRPSVLINTTSEKSTNVMDEQTIVVVYHKSNLVLSLQSKAVVY